MSLDKKCKVITRVSSVDDNSLVSNQEEANTKVILHAKQCLTDSSITQVVIRSPSGDTDIYILIVALLSDFKDRIIFDDNSGDNRKEICLKDIDIDKEISDALIGFHSFTGNDYLRTRLSTCHFFPRVEWFFDCTFAEQTL